MSPLKRGPELKMPELKVKVPAFLANLFHDLRERRLLPLVALLLVAIVAVPFLLGGDSEEEPPVASTSSPGATAGASNADGVRLTVVEAKPGLRDYRKRLQRHTPTDPFVQRHSGPVLDGAELSSQSATLSGEKTQVTTTTMESGSAPGTESGGAPPPTVDGDGPGLKFFEFVLDVQISRTEAQPDGSRRMGEPKVRRKVPGLTPLPSEETPVVTTMGVNLIKEKVMLMVSNEVTAVEGDATCVSGKESCQLLEVKPGFPLFFKYGPDSVLYKFKIVKVDVIWLTPKQAAERSTQDRAGLVAVGQAGAWVQSFSK